MKLTLDAADDAAEYMAKLDREAECEVRGCTDEVDRAGNVYGHFHARCDRHWAELFPDFEQEVWA